MTVPTGRPVAGAEPAVDSPRRYPAPRWFRVFYIAMAAVVLVQALLFHKWIEYLFAGMWLLLAALVWLTPGTVVDAHGYRTWHRLRRRTVAWTDVAEVLDFGPGLAPLQVKVRLTNGQQRTLQHVPGMQVPYLRQLIAQSRQTATRVGLPDPPAQ